MKCFLLTFVFLGILQLIQAAGEENLDHSEHYKPSCLEPKLDGYLDGSSKVHDCPKGKPFGTEIYVSFENDDDFFSYTVKICRRKHKPQLPKKIFNCGLRRAMKQCKTIGLPECVTDESLLYGRWQIVNDCLEKVLRKCSNGEVTHN